MVEFSSPPTMAMPRAKQSPQFARSLAVCPTTVAWPVVPDGAEPCSENMRQEIADKLGIQYCDVYGLSEIMGPGVAMECAERGGLHIAEDQFYCEIWDGNTFTPRMMSMSSVRPRRRPILRWVRPHAHGSALMVVTSRVR